jgi:hypothetical protein
VYQITWHVFLKTVMCSCWIVFLCLFTVLLWVFMFGCAFLYVCYICLCQYVRYSLFVYQSVPGLPPPAMLSGRGTGRANILARFCAKQREAESAPPVAKEGEHKPVNIGRGYALLSLASKSP